jgi:hypothetical protein
MKEDFAERVEDRILGLNPPPQYGETFVEKVEDRVLGLNRMQQGGGGGYPTQGIPGGHQQQHHPGLFERVEEAVMGQNIQQVLHSSHENGGTATAKISVL